MPGYWCPSGCRTFIPDGVALCPMCALALEKYIDENPAVLAALRREAESGIRDLEAMLEAE